MAALPTVQALPSPAAPVVDELHYRLFANAARADSTVTAARYCAAFGGNPEPMQARFDAEQRERQWNAGARKADDSWCQGCGRRGLSPFHCGY